MITAVGRPGIVILQRQPDGVCHLIEGGPNQALTPGELRSLVLDELGPAVLAWGRVEFI